MTVQEALKILDNACATYQGNRADHVAIHQALQIVTESVKPVVEKKEDVKKDKKEPDGNK